MEEDTKKWLSNKFGIPQEEIVWFNSGICYSRIVVTTRSSAEKVRKAVKGETVNGGMLHGMPLGSIGEKEEKDGSITYEIMC